MRSAGKRWLFVIAGMLGANVVATVVLAATAHSGASQVIPDYYDRAVHYDATLEIEARDRALGWTVHSALRDGALVITVRDAAGAPVVATHSHVTGYQRAYADDPFELELAPGIAGELAVAFPTRAGVYDLVIVIDRGDARYVQRASIEVR
jgi:nitrogen fixation protein FixH